MIYVVEILEGKYVKVGYCKDNEPFTRIAQLQTGNPFQIKSVLCVEGTLRQERAIHAALCVGFQRLGMPCPPNEWYPGTNKFMRSFIANMKFGADMGLCWAERYNPAVRQWGKVKAGKKDRSITSPKKWPKVTGSLLSCGLSKAIVFAENQSTVFDKEMA